MHLESRNPRTGKGWTYEEEKAFAEIMAAGGLERLPAIRLYRRFKGSLTKSLKYALEAGARKESVRDRFKRRLQGQNRSVARPVAFGVASDSGPLA